MANHEEGGFWQRPTLAQPRDALPSGLQRFTSVFGMGTGGSTALGSPEHEPHFRAGRLLPIHSVTKFSKKNRDKRRVPSHLHRGTTTNRLVKS